MEGGLRVASNKSQQLPSSKDKKLLRILHPVDRNKNGEVILVKKLTISYKVENLIDVPVTSHLYYLIKRNENIYPKANFNSSYFHL